MKNHFAKGMTLVLAASIGMTGCNSLKKMKKKYDLVTYTVTPDPLEMHGDTVRIAVSGKYPEKYFWKKATVTVNPVIKTPNGEIPLKAKTFVGPKVKGAPTDAQVIAKEGGSFSYNDVVAYKPEMKNATFEIKSNGGYKAKTAEFPMKKIGDATIVTPLLVQAGGKTVMAKDEMPKTVPMSFNADIHYLINASNIRPAETKAEDIAGMVKFVDDATLEMMEGKKVVGTKPMYTIKGFTINSAASPDGELDRNSNLADERGAAAKKYVMEQLKKLNIEGNDAMFQMTSVGEDWAGFKSLMEASTVPDKEMILRILSTYSDNDKREQEMKNISKAYTEISDQIFPKLRKATITVNAEKTCKTDEELSRMATTIPDSLNIEELLYAANLTKDMNTQLAIYQAAARIYPNDWRGHNNAGCVLLSQNKVNDAGAAFEKADKAKSSPGTKNNLGVVAGLKGDWAGAEARFKEAGSQAEAVYNLGALYIKKGDYPNAVASYGSANTFNASLAKLLNGDKEGALRTIDGGEDASTAMGYYLKAVIAARMGNQAALTENIAKAFAKDPSLKNMAKEDKEFVKFKVD